jgi:TetR/AcrR family transcriptional regulator, regulator of cefoperazone and chloramphenicol sensitivity
MAENDSITRGRLLNAAARLFAAQGFKRVTVRDICKEAAANVAAVNYHFGDKRGLYAACLRHAQSCRVDDLAVPQWPADFTAADKLRAFIRGMLESKLDASRPQWHLDMMLREMSRPTDACREIVEDYIRPMAETLGTILQELHPGAAWDRRAWLIGFSIIAQVLFYQINQPVIRLLMGETEFASLTLDELTNHITQFTLAALGQGPPCEPGSTASDGARPAAQID